MFVNPDCLNIAYSNLEYLNLLRRADRVLPDGIGIHLAGRMKGTPMLENVNGTELFWWLVALVVGGGEWWWWRWWRGRWWWWWWWWRWWRWWRRGGVVVVSGGVGGGGGGGVVVAWLVVA